jgi:hypothetical protein
MDSETDYLPCFCQRRWAGVAVQRGRPRALLIVAAHEPLYDALRANLERDNVPFEAG